MRLRFVAADLMQGSLVEAGIDDLELRIFDAAPRLNVYGAEQLGGTLHFNVTGSPGDPFFVAVTSIDPGSIPGPFLQGIAFGGGPLTGVVDSEGLGTVQATLPTSPWVSGATFYFRAVVGAAGSRVPTNTAILTVP